MGDELKADADGSAADDSARDGFCGVVLGVVFRDPWEPCIPMETFVSYEKE